MKDETCLMKSEAELRNVFLKTKRSVVLRDVTFTHIKQHVAERRHTRYLLFLSLVLQVTMDTIYSFTSVPFLNTVVLFQ